MNILIADDEKGTVMLLERRLIKKGHKVDTAFDGGKALELIKLNKYDLVFLDHNMPELTGLELIKYIKNNKLAAITVLVTGYPHIESTIAKHLGADEYVTKPCRLEEFEQIVDKYK